MIVGLIQYLWLSLGLFLHTLYRSIFRRHIMEKGALIVSGKDQITIDLEHRHHPKKIDVHFEGHKHHHHTCNPNYEDTLQWSVCMAKHGTFLLTIGWSVEDIREIKWEVCW